MRRIWILIISFIVVVIAIVGIVALTEEPAYPPAGTGSAPAATPPPTTTQPEAVTFSPITVSGVASKVSPPFTVTTNEWIIDWSYSTDDPEYAVFGFFIYPRGETVMYVESLITTNQQTSGTTYSYAGPGDYYVDAQAANVNGWQVTIRPA